MLNSVKKLKSAAEHVTIQTELILASSPSVRDEHTLSAEELKSDRFTGLHTTNIIQNKTCGSKATVTLNSGKIPVMHSLR